MFAVHRIQYRCPTDPTIVGRNVDRYQMQRTTYGVNSCVSTLRTSFPGNANYNTAVRPRRKKTNGLTILQPMDQRLGKRLVGEISHIIARKSYDIIVSFPTGPLGIQHGVYHSLPEPEGLCRLCVPSTTTLQKVFFPPPDYIILYMVHPPRRRYLWFAVTRNNAVRWECDPGAVVTIISSVNWKMPKIVRFNTIYNPRLF